MQETPTASIKYSQQGFKAYVNADAIPTYDYCPKGISPNDNSLCAEFAVEPYLRPCRGPSPQGEPSQPRLECLELRPPYYLWVLCNALLNTKKKPRQGSQPDIITTDRIRRILKYKRKSKKVHNVINEAIYWGVLTRVWTGSYRINWERCAYVASLPPMNPGDRPLNSMSQHYDKRQWGEFRQGLEVIQEFWAFVSATRVQATELAPTGLPDQLSPPQIPPFVPPKDSRLQYTLLELGSGRLVWALVLGQGNIYLVPAGVRGGAQSCFPCVSYGGKHLCFGSLKALFTFVGSAEPFPYGGHTPRLVVDAGRAGLVPYDSFAPATDRYEVGLQLHDSALLYSCLARWNVVISSGFMSPFKGWPALVLVPREGVSRAVSYRPDIIRRDVLACLDAVRGFIRSAVKGLRGSALSPQSSTPYALALARTVHVEAEGPPIDVYVETIDGLKVREACNTYRHEGGRKLYTIEEFAGLLRAMGRHTTAKTVRVIVPLAESPYLKEALDFGFYYIYHNPLKDQPNAVRAEYRAYEGVTEAYGKEGTMKLALGTLHMLDQALATTYQALART